ncbi:MAG TPA: aspartate aminotransferase family protein [Planctomycetaceae bacterium]|nr:aspartate aminotransferase family protein [Planctomycetaceae bacterium]|tara:strand:- start:2470 stop:3855 length:1386 start_codon:yes stop_codon:yes gene_type:complete
MNQPIRFPGEDRSNAAREVIGTREPVALRTFTPSQAVLARSAGVFHWTPEGRRLYDFTSGVLVANLGHNPRGWLKRLAELLGWDAETLAGGEGYAEALTLTAYNAVTEIEATAVERLLANVASSPGGERLDSVCWAASGSEAIQKALWACLHLRPERDHILATRHGFHGKKGLAGAVTGCETDHDRDPRVRFISFPMADCDDADRYGEEIDLSPYREELETIWDELGDSIGTLITEPYLGGGGSYHPPPAYLQMLESFCRDHDILFILDEVQANFGRTGHMYAFEKYGIAPDLVALGKGLGNGIPVSAVVGRGDVLASLKYGEASDTWSANPIGCAAVIATLDAFEDSDVLENTRRLEPMFFEELGRLKETGVVSKVRGEGMVYGIECADVGTTPAGDVANAIVEACYLGADSGDGIHLLGPLANTVLRISPPMTITDEQARESLRLLNHFVHSVGQSLAD